MKSSTLVRLVAIVVFTAAASCSGGGYSTGLNNNNNNNNNNSTSDAIDVNDNTFSPAATTVPAGTAVTWTWKGANPHTVTFDDGTTSAQQTSGTYQRTFMTAGTYNYHCKVHGNAMSGSVTVQ